MIKNQYIMLKYFFIFIWLVASAQAIAQNQIKAGFNAEEYRTLLKIAQRQVDSNRYAYKIPYPTGYKRVFTSKVQVMQNRWSLWTNEKEKIAVIHFRGTTMTFDSWLENFYAAMIPAQGQISLKNGKIESYQFASDSGAFVHAGWAIAVIEMHQEIDSIIQKYKEKGYRDFILFGHSQGGALAFLYRSMLVYRPEILSPGIRIKTYGSATPKVGNQFFSYDFDYNCGHNLSFRVINPKDWVAQMPFGVQTLNDISAPNPFIDAEKNLGKMGFIKRFVLKRKYKKLKKALQKAQEELTETLGDDVHKIVTKYYPHQKINFSNSFHYATTGNAIILMPDKAYDDNYVAHRKYSIFLHHGLYAYYFLSLNNYPERD